MASLPLLETTSAAVATSHCRPKALRPTHAPLLPKKIKGLGRCCGSSNLFLSSRRQKLLPSRNTRSIVSCTVSMTEGESSGPRKLNLDNLMSEMKKLWESLPQPVKSFPWPEALENFLQLTLSLVFEVAKYLAVPVLFLTSLSELSYCAHERKMRLVPIPLLAGFAMAWIFRDKTRELYQQLKEGEFPLHLVTVAAIFVLLKLPGPYYPYWVRIFIPQFANGGLLTSLWFSVMWYRKSSAASEIRSQQSPTNDYQAPQEN